MESVTTRRPNIEGLDFSGCPDEELGKFAVKKLVEAFYRLPENKRKDMLMDRMQNRDDFLLMVRQTMHAARTDAVNENGNAVGANDLETTAEKVVDIVLNALSAELETPPSQEPDRKIPSVTHTFVNKVLRLLPVSWKNQNKK